MSAVDVMFDRSGVIRGRGAVARFARQILGELLARHGGGEVTVLFCGPARMARLNNEFLGKQGPTDVLSFPSGMPTDEPGAARGDLAICLPYVAQECRAKGRDLGDELALLLVHGFLHLMGWDHDTAARERRMWARQDKLLATLGAIDWPDFEVMT